MVTLRAGTIKDACREMLPHLTGFEERLKRARTHETEPELISEPHLEDIEAAVRAWFSDWTGARSRRPPTPGLSESEAAPVPRQAHDDDALALVHHDVPIVTRPQLVADC